MPSGDDLQLAGELSCENATVRCHLQVGCDLDLEGDINAENVNATNVTTTNLTATNATITNATITNATIGSLVVDTLQVGQLAMKELNLPSINTSPQNNLVIAGLTSNMLLRFMLAGGAGNISLTGIDKPMPALGGYARIWMFYNRTTSTKTLTIEHQNAGSLAQNRFINRGAVAVVLNPGEARWYYYDEGSSRWVQAS